MWHEVEQGESQECSFLTVILGEDMGMAWSPMNPPLESFIPK